MDCDLRYYMICVKVIWYLGVILNSWVIFKIIKLRERFSSFVFEGEFRFVFDNIILRFCFDFEDWEERRDLLLILKVFDWDK